MRPITKIVVHTSATRPDDVAAHDIDRWHKKRGWRGIGYHFVIRLNGALEKGRDIAEIGAHVKGHNADSIGICMVGGLDQYGNPADTYSDAQYETLRALVDALKRAFPNSDVLGHRDLSPDIDGDGRVDEWEWVKACPCFDVRAWYESVSRGS